MSHNPRLAPHRAAIARLFEARSIAIVGASPDQAKLSSAPLNSLAQLGFQGQVVAVNPNHERIMGWPCVRSVAELPEHVEAAMIILPAHLALEAAEACALKGIRSLVIPAQGFGEAGETERDAQLLALVRRHGIALCGPNTNGLANVETGLALAFMPMLQYPDAVRPGAVSVVSQSGSLVSSLLVALRERGIGVAKLVTCGNERVLGAADYLDYLADDARTRVVILYLETIRDAGALRAALRRCRANGKAVVALKMGMSAPAQRAALSHTGAIAGSYQNTLAFLRAEGALVAEELSELPVMAECLIRHPWPTGFEAKPFVLAISGGFAGLAADTMARLGMRLAEPSPAAQDALRALPTQSHPVNPYDIAAQNALIPTLVDIFRRDGFNLMVFGMAMLKPEIRDTVLEQVIAARRAGLEHVFLVAPQLDAAQVELLHAQGISVHTDLRLLLLALRGLAHHREDRIAAAGDAPTSAAAPAPAPPLPPQEGLVDEATSKAWLRDLGVRTPASRVLSGSLDLAALAGLRRPLALKGLSARVAHKTEHGLVALDLRTDEALRDADRRIRQALADVDPEARDVLAEEMVDEGLEVIVGVQRDATVGSVVLVGAGGLMAEFLGDAAVLMPPFGPAQARLALARTRVGQLLLNGWRGRRYDADALVDLLVRLGQVALQAPRLASLDINPVRVGPPAQGVVALDAKLHLAPPD